MTPYYAASMQTCIQMFVTTGKWSNINCAEKLHAICEKDPIIISIPDEDEECTSPECCKNHLGAEYGGALPASAFYASSTKVFENENITSADASLGRLNQPYSIRQTGGWLSALNDHNPWLEVQFGNFMEIRGIITQGVNEGTKNSIGTTFRDWTKSFSIKYLLNENEFSDLTDSTGTTVLFEGNYDVNTHVTNMFPQVLVSKDTVFIWL